MRTIILSGGTGNLGAAVIGAFQQGAFEADRLVIPWISPRERDRVLAAHPEAIAAGRLVLVAADVAEEEGAAAVHAIAGPTAVLVNLAGGWAGGTVQEAPLSQWDELFRTNVRTAVALCRVVLPDMIAAGEGVILNVASRSALERTPGAAAYAAAKSAVVALTETLAREAGPSGVRVNAVAPGIIDTPANRAGMPDADWTKWTPPSRIASVLCWLASDGARTVNGAIVPV